MVAAALFRDGFSGTSLDATKWVFSGTAPNLTASPGEARFVGTGAVNSRVNPITTVDTYDLYDSGYAVKIRKTTSANFHISVFAGSTSWNGNKLVLYTSGTTIRGAMVDNTNSQYYLGSTTYNATTMQYVRIRRDESVPGYRFETSADAVTWTSFHAIDSQQVGDFGGMDYSATRLSIWAGGGGTNYVYVDQVNPDLANPEPSFKTVTLPFQVGAVAQTLMPIQYIVTEPPKVTIELPWDFRYVNEFVSAYDLDFKVGFPVYIRPALVSTGLVEASYFNYEYTRREKIVALPVADSREADWYDFVVGLSDSMTIPFPHVVSELAHLRWNREQLPLRGQFKMELISTKPAWAPPHGAPETFQTWTMPNISAERTFVKWASGDLPTGGKLRLPMIDSGRAYAMPHGPETDLGLALPYLQGGAYAWMKWNGVDPGVPDPTAEKFKSFQLPLVFTRRASAYNIPVAEGSLKISNFIVISTVPAMAANPRLSVRYPPKGLPNSLEFTVETKKMDIKVIVDEGFAVMIDYHLMQVGFASHNMEVQVTAQRVDQ